MEDFETAEVASETLVALSRNHFSLVMYELQHHLKPLNLTDEFVIVTLAKLANGNGKDLRSLPQFLACLGWPRAPSCSPLFSLSLFLDPPLLFLFLCDSALCLVLTTKIQFLCLSLSFSFVLSLSSPLPVYVYTHTSVSPPLFLDYFLLLSIYKNMLSSWPGYTCSGCWVLAMRKTRVAPV